MSFPDGASKKGAQESAKANVAKAREFYAPLLAEVLAWRREGMSLRAIAAELTRRRIKTRQELERWSAMQVKRLVARAEAESIGADGSRGDQGVGVIMPPNSER